ncbi:MAG: endonuclease/exonuclease/phosphatase [Ferruginibacter sp.]
MQKLLITVILISFSFVSYSQQHQYKSALIGFYNLENFYDTVNNPLVDDEEFLPSSEKQYNSHVYLDKISRLSSVIYQIGTDINPDGLALCGVAEIENDTVLNDLINLSQLKSRGIKFEHYDSPDKRGVDVGLLYNPKYFKVLFSAPLFVKLPGGSKDSYFTRDVLYVKGILGSDTIHVFVNHWPSRSGGEERSIPARAAAATVCKIRVDSLMAINPKTKIVIMGDLNDDPVSPSLVKVLKAKSKISGVSSTDIYNPWVDFYKQGIGTLAYQDAWGLFDQILLSGSWLDKNQKELFYYKATIFNKEFLTQTTGRYKGYTKRTWDGNTYNYGYSDHFPVFVTLLKKID